MISCIVPVYNAERYLSNCVDSILNQTYSDFELILVDDGSTDGSRALCRKYAAQSDKTVVIEKENGGAASARNAGLDAAKGDYIVFIDGDDTVEPDYFEQLISAAVQADADLVVSGAFDERGFSGTPFAYREYTKSAYIKAALTELNRVCVFGPCYKLINAKRIRENKVRFPERYRLSEDRLFNLQLMEHIEKAVTIPYRGYHYTDNAASLTHNRLKKEVLGNIIDAELETLDVMQSVVERHLSQDPFFDSWMDKKRYNALLTLNLYIVKIDLPMREKQKLRKKLFAVISYDSEYLAHGIGKRILRFSIRHQNLFVFSACLSCIRLADALKHRLKKITRFKGKKK